MIRGILLLCFSFMVNFKNIKMLVILLGASLTYYVTITIVVLEGKNCNDDEFKIWHDSYNVQKVIRHSSWP